MIARTLHRDGVTVQIKVSGELVYMWRGEDGLPRMGSRLSKIGTPWSRQFKQLIRECDLVVIHTPRAPDRIE